MIKAPQSIIIDFISVAKLAGYSIDSSDIVYEFLSAPHQPKSLPKGKQAVYVFSLSKEPNSILKVGKVGSKSNARFLSQHYNFSSSRSNLAKSLIENNLVLTNLGIIDFDNEDVGNWIRKNTDRENFYLDSKHGLLLLSLLEVFLQCRLEPVFEG